MRTGRASKTAEHNALFRALEARKPRAERLFDDPYVHKFLSPAYRATAALARLRPWRAFALRTIDRGWPGVRPTVVARTRLIDEMISDLAGLVDQVVILGAGFDTRAWRLAALRDVPVFEVDHPDTQRRKLDRVGTTPAHVRFVATDFHLGELGRSLADAGYAPTTRTLFLWEGVTNYLTEPTVDATLRWCAEAAPGSHLIVTYIDSRVLTDPDQFPGADRVFATLHRAGEEMTFGMPPADMPAYLATRGLTLITDLAAPTIRARYLPPTPIQGHDFYHVAHATI